MRGTPTKQAWRTRGGKPPCEGTTLPGGQPDLTGFGYSSAGTSSLSRYAMECRTPHATQGPMAAVGRARMGGIGRFVREGRLESGRRMERTPERAEADPSRRAFPVPRWARVGGQPARVASCDAAGRSIPSGGPAEPVGVRRGSLRRCPQAGCICRTRPDTTPVRWDSDPGEWCDSRERPAPYTAGSGPHSVMIADDSPSSPAAPRSSSAACGRGEPGAAFDQSGRDLGAGGFRESLCTNRARPAEAPSETGLRASDRLNRTASGANPERGTFFQRVTHAPVPHPRL